MSNQEPPGTRLEGWKAIARYLGKDPRTALRWVGLGLPVWRVNGPNSSVYAYSDEVEAWLRGRATTFDTGAVRLAREVGAAPAAERDPRRASPRDLVLQAVAAGRVGDGTAWLPRDADEVLSLVRDVAGHVLAPDTAPLVLAHALAAACRSFLEMLHTPVETLAPRDARRRAADGRAPFRPSRAPLPDLGAEAAAVSRSRPPLG